MSMTPLASPALTTQALTLFFHDRHSFRFYRRSGTSTQWYVMHTLADLLEVHKYKFEGRCTAKTDSWSAKNFQSPTAKFSSRRKAKQIWSPTLMIDSWRWLARLFSQFAAVRVMHSYSYSSSQYSRPVGPNPRPCGCLNGIFQAWQECPTSGTPD